MLGLENVLVSVDEPENVQEPRSWANGTIHAHNAGKPPELSSGGVENVSDS